MPLIVALPALLLAVVHAVILATALLGRHPMWPIPDLNLSEAAAARDPATVVLLIGRGEDPNAVRTVRVGILDESEVQLTPVEAALDARRVEIIDLLLRHGVLLDEAHRVAFTCKAKSRGDADIAAYFEARGGTITCGEQVRQ